MSVLTILIVAVFATSSRAANAPAVIEVPSECIKFKILDDAGLYDRHFCYILRRMTYARARDYCSNNGMILTDYAFQSFAPAYQDFFRTTEGLIFPIMTKDLFSTGCAFVNKGLSANVWNVDIDAACNSEASFLCEYRDIFEVCLYKSSIDVTSQHFKKTMCYVNRNLNIADTKAFCTTYGMTLMTDWYDQRWRSWFLENSGQFVNGVLIRYNEATGVCTYNNSVSGCRQLPFICVYVHDPLASCNLKLNVQDVSGAYESTVCHSRNSLNGNDANSYCTNKRMTLINNFFTTSLLGYATSYATRFSYPMLVRKPASSAAGPECAYMTKIPTATSNQLSTGICAQASSYFNCLYRNILNYCNFYHDVYIVRDNTYYITYCYINRLMNVTAATSYCTSIGMTITPDYLSYIAPTFVNNSARYTYPLLAAATESECYYITTSTATIASNNCATTPTTFHCQFIY